MFPDFLRVKQFASVIYQSHALARAAHSADGAAVVVAAAATVTAAAAAYFRTTIQQQQHHNYTINFAIIRIRIKKRSLCLALLCLCITSATSYNIIAHL